VKNSRTFLPSLALILLGCGPNNLPPTAQPPPLAASRFTGTCEIQSTPKLWSPLHTNQPVQPGSRLRTAADSFIELKSTSSLHRILLAHDSEAAIDRWAPPGGAAEGDAAIDVRQGLVLIDLPVMSATSKFELKGSNFVTSIRSAGPTVAAITSDGFVFVQTGTIVCISISPTVTAVTLNAGQMFDPVALISKPIPAASNQVWNLLSE